MLLFQCLIFFLTLWKKGGKNTHKNTNASLRKTIFLVTDQLFGYLTTLFYKNDWYSVTFYTCIWVVLIPELS